MSHWYSETGQAAHTVLAKNGTPRSTTLADARKQNLLPSVTTVIKSTLAAPQLEQWKVTQAIHAALTLPEIPGESLEDRVRRVREDSEAQAKAAAAHGSAVHDAFCKYLHGQDVAPEFAHNVEALQAQIDSGFGLMLGPVRTVWSEKTLVGDGYAGTADWLIETSQGLAVVDFKGQEVRDGKPSVRQEYWIQLAAYAAATGLVINLVGTIVFDRKTGAMYPEFRTMAEIENETAIWWNLLDTWQRLKNYKPVLRAA